LSILLNAVLMRLAHGWQESQASTRTE